MIVANGTEQGVDIVVMMLSVFSDAFKTKIYINQDFCRSQFRNDL